MGKMERYRREGCEMSHEFVGLVGLDFPWKRLVNASMSVEAFASVGSRVVDGKLIKLGGGMPPPTATVVVLLNDPAARAANGADSIRLLLPVTHVDDFRVFSWVFEERVVADNEEVIVTYMPASGLFGGRKARFAVGISPKGTLRSTFAAVQRGEEEPDGEPIWMHHPRTPFTPPKGSV